MVSLTVLLLFADLIGLCICSQAAGSTVQYDEASFTDNINTNNHFVMFYAPWCSHCERLEPVWEQLGLMLNDEGSNVVIAKVDCTKEGKLCSEQDITGYPTLKYFSVDELEPIKYKGVHELNQLTAFLDERLGSAVARGGADKEKRITDLTDKNFECGALEIGMHFVEFYAPWCGHCQRLAPTWEALANEFSTSEHVKIIKVDCTINKKTCGFYEIKSYPTLLWIENGKKVDKYSGQRKLEDLISYVSDRILNTKITSHLADTWPSQSGASHTTKDPPSGVISIDSTDFSKFVGDKMNFVQFYAPWCGHCKGLAPTWEELAKKMSNNKNLAITKLDCTKEENKEFCNEQQVEGFPTLILFKVNGQGKVYKGSRSIEDLIEFIGANVERDEL